MASYVKISRTDYRLLRGSCHHPQFTPTINTWLKRRCLLPVLMLCMLTVMLMIDRWVLLTVSQMFSSPGVGILSALLEGCTGETPSRCFAYNMRTNAANSGPPNLSREGATAFSARCSPDAATEMADNVYSNDVRPVRRLPQCLIIGVQKGGTAALVEFLNLHPHVRVKREEMHFFNREDNYTRGLEWYRRQMPPTHADQITVEKTPNYFLLDQNVSRVYQMNSSIRLLLSFRDPVERVISGYLETQDIREIRGLPPELNFERVVISNKTGDIDDTYRPVIHSMYDVHMEWWLKYFSLDQFHFLSAENLTANPVEELQKVENFLGLQHKLTKDLFYFDESKGFYCMCVNKRGLHASRHKWATVEQTCLSSSKGRTHPSIDPYVLNKLRNFFRPHNDRLYKMVGINFGWK